VDAWLATAARGEELGYSSLILPDHFNDQLAPFPALAAAAMRTSRIRLGVYVACNDFRHPAVLAKEAATLDALSGGRLELGLGAGWMESEYRQIGLTFDAPGVRIGRLEESLALVKLLLDGGPVSFSGDHYRVRDMEILPRPVQRPRPPIVVGGGGRRVLSLAGREADIVSINTNNRHRVGLGAHPDLRLPAVRDKIRWVREAAGARAGPIEINLTVMIAAVTDDRRGYAAMVAPEFGLEVDEILDSPFALIGSAKAITERVQEIRADLGISYLTVSSRVLEDFAPIVGAVSGC
jgi:probable F420-dependent oxidoreductase